MGVDCEMCVNIESMFVIMAVRESNLHTNFENIPTNSNDVAENKLKFQKMTKYR